MSTITINKKYDGSGHVKVLAEIDFCDGEDNLNMRKLDLTGANMSSMNLKGASLEEATLAYACLNYSNLDNARFIDTNVRDATLREASLRNADFSFANLEHVSLYEADLENACFKRANLSYATLAEANLVNVTMTDANLTNTIGDFICINGVAEWGQITATRTKDSYTIQCGCRTFTYAQAMTYWSNKKHRVGTLRAVKMINAEAEARNWLGTGAVRSE